jgi:hypothetical protein
MLIAVITLSIVLFISVLMNIAGGIAVKRLLRHWRGAKRHMQRLVE